ncbi:MAG: carotenoid oxygenase family protein, partial [Proteobacteria bacterium]|nr:carotenoid oxygenase family protein [Pseudomonadota bacterium]
GKRKLTFFGEQPSRFGVIPRHGNNSSVRWFEAKPCFVLHLSNCYEQGDWVIMDGCIQDNPGKPAVGVQGEDAHEQIRRHFDKTRTRPHMYRWQFNMRTGETREGPLEDEVSEFPVVPNDIVGLPYRYTYNALFEPGDWYIGGLKRFDVTNGEQSIYKFGERRYGSEGAIALRPNPKSEDDGYVLTFITDLNANSSECVILDAADVAAGPVARVMLPGRITNGTHACWVEADRYRGERV